MITRMLRRIAGVMMVAVLCAGCTGLQWGRADSDATITSPKDAYVVFGVQPELAKVSLFVGEFLSGSFKQDRLPSASFIGFPEDGYVVTRVSPDTAYAVTYVTLYATGNELLVPPLVPCAGAKTIAFKVPAGKVLYVGDVKYLKAGSGAVPEFSAKFDTAKRYMDTHYPNLSRNLTDGGLQLATVNSEGCARY